MYQAPDNNRTGPVQIVANRPPGPEGVPGGPPGYPAHGQHHPPSSPYAREAAQRAGAYGEQPMHHNHTGGLGLFPTGPTQSLPMMLPLRQPDRPGFPSGAHDPNAHPSLVTDPSAGTYERPIKRSRALSLPNAGVLRRVNPPAGGSRSTTALGTPRSPVCPTPSAVLPPVSLAAASGALGTGVPSLSSSLSDMQKHNPAHQGAQQHLSQQQVKKGPVAVGRQTNESELLNNDWEHVVNMYMTGEGTQDGRPLREITRGDGRRVEDRKLLEKRRTIGKTFEKLGRPLFEAAIGYKMEGKYRRKQKMYHVIARCRVVNGFRKVSEDLPTDPVKLTALIDQKMHEKAMRGAAAAEAAANAAASAAAGGAQGAPASPRRPSHVAFQGLVKQETKGNALLAAAAHHQAQHALLTLPALPASRALPQAARPPLGPVDFAAPDRYHRGEAGYAGDKVPHAGSGEAPEIASGTNGGGTLAPPQKRPHA